MSDPLDQDLQRLTRRLVASYRRESSTQRVGAASLPSRGKVVEILEQLRQLLFPGYFGKKQLTAQNIQYHVGNLLVPLGRDLTEQICHCLCGTTACPEKDACDRTCHRITIEFFSRIPRLRRVLALDVQAAYDGDPAAKSIAEIIYCYPGFYAVTVYRIAHELHELSVPLIPRIMTEYAHSQTGADIHPGARIGKSFFIDHATGVVIGETTIIGHNVKIYQGVTLGAHSFPKDERGRAIRGLKRHPTIEDNVTIYANATILGGQTVIGRGSTIGGNTFIDHPVPPNHVVQLEPPNQHVQKKKKQASPRK